VALSARGARETDGGTEPIADTALADALRRKARDVYVKTSLATLAFASAMFFLGM
jgi:hypothetical protein